MVSSLKKSKMDTKEGYILWKNTKENKIHINKI